MSCLVTRPEMPLPGTAAMSTPCSAAILRTTGDERCWRSSSAVISALGFSGAAGTGVDRAAGAGGGGGGVAIWIRCVVTGAAATGVAATGAGDGAGAGGAGVGAGGAATASPSAPITATTVLIGTVVPGSKRISLRTPEAGAGISASTLSVEISKRGSSRWTLSPTFFIHLVMVPSAIDSPIWGMITSVMGFSSGGNQGRPRGAAISNHRALARPAPPSGRWAGRTPRAAASTGRACRAGTGAPPARRGARRPAR